MMSMSPDRAKREILSQSGGGDYSAAPAATSSSQASGADANPVASVIQLTIPADAAGTRLDAALAQLMPQFSRSRLQTWLKQGAIRVDGAAAQASDRVAGGETIAVQKQPEPQTLAWQAERIALDIVYEDDALLVINKPPGLVVHPGHGNWSGTVLNALLQHSPQATELPRAGIVHRLDKDTSGLMVVAKTLEAHTDLVRQLQSRSVARRYLAIVEGAPDARGKVNAPIGRHPTQRTKMAVTERGREAVTEYKVIERLGRYSLLELKLHTGRTHQIRVHMQSLGFPLLGDQVYGRRRGASALKFARQALHAVQLALRHPVSKAELSWRVEPPEDFATLLAQLQSSA